MTETNEQGFKYGWHKFENETEQSRFYWQVRNGEVKKIKYKAAANERIEQFFLFNFVTTIYNYLIICTFLYNEVSNKTNSNKSVNEEKSQGLNDKQIEAARINMSSQIIQEEFEPEAFNLITQNNMTSSEYNLESNIINKTSWSSNSSIIKNKNKKQNKGNKNGLEKLENSLKTVMKKKSKKRIESIKEIEKKFKKRYRKKKTIIFLR